MANDPEPPSSAHTLALLDESSESSLAICKCGARFLEVGPNHPAEARYSHALHRYDVMMLAPLDAGGRAPIEPVRPGAPKPIRIRKPRKGDEKRLEQTAEILRLIEGDGLNVSAAALAMGISPHTVTKRLYDAERDDLIKKRPRQAHTTEAAA